MKKPDFLHVDTDSQKLKKSWLKNIGVGVVKNRCGHSGLSTLKLFLYQEGINGKSDLWGVGKYSGKPKVTLIIFRWW